MYTRKTEDEYQIQGYYNSQWETVTTETTRSEAKQQLKCYRENETGTAFRMVKKRIKKHLDKE